MAKKQEEGAKKVSIEDKVPAFIVEHGPTIRLDREFMHHVIEKNDYCKKQKGRGKWAVVKSLGKKTK